jgi:hypothetical protein
LKNNSAVSIRYIFLANTIDWNIFEEPFSQIMLSRLLNSRNFLYAATVTTKPFGILIPNEERFTYLAKLQDKLMIHAGIRLVKLC